MKTEKEKWIKKILINCIYLIIGLSVFYNIAFSINTTMLEKDYFKLFGISFFNMESDLMQDDINKNDFVIVKEVNEGKLQEGDIIAYTINGKTRINKIINEQDGYVTRSNKNYYPDIEKVMPDEVIGKVEMCIPLMGFAIGILQSKVTTGFVLVVLVLILLYNRYAYIKKIERARKKREKRGRFCFCPLRENFDFWRKK